MMNTTHPDVSVVIINWNVRDLLVQCLRSLQVALAGVQHEIIVVDNGSVDHSAQVVKQEYPDVRLIANKENIGFARANNLAIRECKGRHLLLLNPDTIVFPDTVQQMVAFMERRPDAGIGGCRQIYSDGEWQPTCHRMITLRREAIVAMGLAKMFPQWVDYGDLPQKAREPFPVDWVGGACLIGRHDLIQRVGLLDENLFMYAEDADLCHRVGGLGYSVYYLPNISIIHHRGQSASRSSQLPISPAYSILVQQFIAKRYVIRKHYGELRGFLYYGLIIVELVRRLLQHSLASLLRHSRSSRSVSPPTARDYVAALRAALTGKM